MQVYSSNKYKNLSIFFFFLLLIVVYFSIYYFTFNSYFRLDFTSFYAAGLALKHHLNPYLVLETNFLPIVKKLPANLNPPSLLMLFQPFSWCSYPYAILLWSVISLFMGLMGAIITYLCAFSSAFKKKYSWITLLLFFGFYPVVINSAIAQLGTFILFFIMGGYYSLQHKKNWTTGLLWGGITAFKIFPGLLFIYLLYLRKFKVLLISLGFFLSFSLLPALLYGTQIYTQYFSMLKQVTWYGDNWNASLFGFIFRLLSCQDTHLGDLCTKIYLISASLLLFIYCLGLKQMVSKQAITQGFSFTLVFMLLLSPMGWFYYFSILALPLTLSWRYAALSQPQSIGWIISLFLLNFPMEYVSTTKMGSLVSRMGIYSFHFYGLMLLAVLIFNIKLQRQLEEPQASHLLSIPYIILSFSLLVFMAGILKYFLLQ